jgi:hypothetical protein
MKEEKASRLELANKYLRRAKEQYDEAAVDSWEPQQPADCVTKCFYSYGNAISAAAAAVGLDIPENHYDKAKLANRLFKEHKVSIDMHDLLLELNELRKNVSYGEPGPELAETDLEDLLDGLEQYLGDVQKLVKIESR